MFNFFTQVIWFHIRKLFGYFGSTYIDGSRAVGRLSSSLVIPIMKTVRSDGYQCRLFLLADDPLLLCLQF